MLMAFRKFLAALVLFGAMVACHGAAAATMYTYSFEQTGYTVDWNGKDILPATLKGSFTGSVDAFHITLGTLSAFHVQFDTVSPSGTHSASYSGLPDYFSFQIGDSGGTLAFQSPLPLFTGASSEACIGAAVSILCNGGIARGYVRVALGSTLLFSSRTDIGPTVNLVSVATTPIPGALFLLTTALSGLGVMGFRRHLTA